MVESAMQCYDRAGIDGCREGEAGAAVFTNDGRAAIWRSSD
jgi:hypothetical protein